MRRPAQGRHSDSGLNCLDPFCLDPFCNAPFPNPRTGTPAAVRGVLAWAITDRLYKEYTLVSQMPEVQKFLAEQGLVCIPPNTQARLIARIDAERARWGQIIAEQGIKVEQ